jgi:hypothetical protein
MFVIVIFSLYHFIIITLSIILYPLSLCSYHVVCSFHCSLILMFVLWDLSQALIELVVVVLLVLTNYNIRSYRSYHHCDISLINISLCLTFHLSASLSFHFPPAIPILPINIITLLTLFVCWVVVTIFIYNHPLFTVCKRIVSKILALNQ